MVETLNNKDMPSTIQIKLLTWGVIFARLLKLPKVTKPAVRQGAGATGGACREGV